MIRSAKRFDRRCFPLSEEAATLIQGGRWALVELADGPAAQGLILGGGLRVTRPDAPPDLFDGLDDATDAQGDLFGRD